MVMLTIPRYQENARDWPTATVEEIAEKVAMGPFGSSIKVETFVPDGIPIISGQHLRGFRVDDSPGHNFITHEHAQRLANSNVSRGDIIFTHAGNIGQVSYIPEDSKFERYIVSQRQFYMRCDTNRVIPEFVTLYFKSREGQHQLLANTSQVGVPSISRPVSYLRTIVVPVPALPEQRRIAHILGTLDDKIELNRRVNETLEEMARAIFKDWFVDFGPVRAKMDGRDAYLPEEIWRLFPDRLVDSELGEVPEGWGIGRLGDVTQERRYSVTPEQIKPGTPYIGLQHMPRHRITLSEWVTADGLASAKLRFAKGDVLFGRLRPYFHKVGVAPVDGVCSTDIAVISPKQRNWFGFALGHASSSDFVNYTDAGSTGTKMPRTSWKEMSRYPLVHPTRSVASAHDQTIRPMVDLMIASVHEATRLTESRDLLLPRLVSGELRE